MTEEHPDEARRDLLSRITHANEQAGATEPEVPRDYARTSELAPGSDEVVDLLEARLVDYRARVSRCYDAGVADAIATALTAAGARRIVVPEGLPHDWVQALEQGDFEKVVVDDGTLSAERLDELDAVVTGAAVAAAVTGTVVLDGSPDQGRRAISLVPDVHVCVLHADQIVGSVPEMLAALEPTRPTTFISGPSATSDIELERVEGVHGPRTLHVVLVIEPDDAA
ncbi:MAG: LUD domain-containing protein [Nocardioidaceae bacterium]|nr:LUD domain-containing protein [Nocardioidaceae bacterium]